MVHPLLDKFPKRGCVLRQEVDVADLVPIPVAEQARLEDVVLLGKGFTWRGVGDRFQQVTPGVLTTVHESFKGAKPSGSSFLRVGCKECRIRTLGNAQPAAQRQGGKYQGSVTFSFHFINHTSLRNQLISRKICCTVDFACPSCSPPIRHFDPLCSNLQFAHDQPPTSVLCCSHELTPVLLKGCALQHSLLNLALPHHSASPLQHNHSITPPH